MSSSRAKKLLNIALFALAHLALLGVPQTSVASTAYGSLNNFDCVNDTGFEAHGFDIELDDVRAKDITYTYDWNHYGVPAISEDLTDPLHPKVLVRYASTKKPDGTWAAYTAIPSGPILPTDGHQFTDPSVNFGGEHFGVGFYANPTAVRYFWLIDSGGTLTRGAPVYVSTPVFNYIPPAVGVPAVVIPVVVPPPPPAPPVYQFGNACWVKDIKTTTHNANKVELKDLVGDDAGKPQPWANGEPDEVETEWRILQTDFSAGDGGANGELAGAPEEMPNGDEIITRRYEFFKYTGPIDAESGQAMADTVGPDGIHGIGIVTYNDHIDPDTGEWVTVTVDLSTVEVVGEFYGAQMSGFDAAPVLGIIDNLQSGEQGVAYPERTVVVGGGFAFFANVASGAVPLGMTFDGLTGILSGTPLVAGPYSFTIEATDLGGAYVSKAYNLTITGGEVVPQYVIATGSSPEAGGTTSGGGSFNLGDNVELQAYPNAGYYFTEWTENGIHFSFTPTYSFTASSNRTLVANFVADEQAPYTDHNFVGTEGWAPWYTGSVEVTLYPSDDLSGVATTYYKLDGGATETYVGKFTVANSAAHTLSYWSVDNAGNVEGAKNVNLKIDALAPSVTASAVPVKIWPANAKMVPVTITGTVTDSLSGVNLTSGAYSTVDSYGLVEPSGTFTVASDGSYSFTIQVESRRIKKDPAGRTYTVTVQASDRNGNQGTANTVILVPMTKN